MNTLIDRIFKSWKSSLVGLIVLVGAMTLVFFEKATLTEALTFIIGGIGLFFIKDPVKK